MVANVRVFLFVNAIIFVYICNLFEIVVFKFDFFMEKQNQQPVRLQSLDALRGFDMLFIMGGGALLVALATMFPIPFFQAIAEQTSHVEWNGCHMEDMIFPTFLFIAGISFPFSLEKQRLSGKSEGDILRKIVRRGLTLVFLGVVYNGLLDFDFSTQRYASVLGRIGLAWMCAALLFVYARTRTRAIVAVAILVGYWLLLRFVPAPDAAGADSLTMEGCLVGYVDRLLLPGRLHLTIHDPEGLLSTLPAVVTAMLGMFTGEFIKWKKEGLGETRKVAVLATAGVGLVAVGLIWNLFFPINKQIWSSSFVCFVGGISTLLFALFYYVIDVKNHRRWTLFFRVIGMNSITIYLAQHFIRFSYTNQALFGGLSKLVPESAGPFVLAVGYIAVCWGFLYVLYKQRIFLKV